ncbi:MAG: xanthine dehydrogenase family protein molybdopterin-binding subunit [Planctomycetota bacterium]
MSANQARSSVSRRDFLRGSAASGGGLILAIAFGDRVLAQPISSFGEATTFEPNAFLRIDTDGRVTFFSKHDEMGQGIHTGLAIAIAEELDIDVADVDVLPAPSAPEYNHSVYGVQGTGGSTSTWSSFDQMRSAGAVARTMLVAAAAARWGVAPEDCVAKDGRVTSGSNAAGYGELAADAAKLEAPANVELKDPSKFTRIGRSTPRVDSPAKIRGTAVFSYDQRRPGMLTAMVERPPTFGGSVKSFDATEALKVPGVRKVVEVPRGVAVIATGFWPARKGREALAIEWNDGPGAQVDTDRLRREYRQRTEQSGVVVRSDGDFGSTLDGADEVLEAVYEVPFQAHAPMEPLSCMVELQKDGGAHITTGSQFLGIDHGVAASVLGVPPNEITFENSYLGGGFGRRASPVGDFTAEAVQVAMAARDLGAPIKTVWTREDDLKGGWYRPMWVNGIAGVLKGGKIVGWRHRIVGQSIATGTAFEGAMVSDGIDQTSVEGAADMPHGVPNLQVELSTTALAVPVQWWRSVGHSNTAFAKECFIDECAERLGKDGYQMRRELLQGHDRLLAVLDRAAEASGWSSAPPEGIGRGISVHESFKGFAAHVVEASVVDGKPRLHRVVCAIDCGLVVNPDQVKSQMQGAANFALSAALESEITLTNGRVDQSNFDDFPIVRMHEAPRVEVHIVDTGGEMGGIGEVGVPGVAPALCAALYQVSGKRIRRLPIGDQLA